MMRWLKLAAAFAVVACSLATCGEGPGPETTAPRAPLGDRDEDRDAYQPPPPEALRLLEAAKRRDDAKLRITRGSGPAAR